MDEDFTRVFVIIIVLVGLTAVFLWLTSRAKRRVVKAVKEVQEALKFTPVASSHPQLGAVWCAAKGQLSGITVKIFGGKSGRGSTGGSSTIDKAFIMIIASLPAPVPFRCSMQRKSALSTPKFGTSYADFDKIIEVSTDNEKKALTLLNNDQLRGAIINFMKKPNSIPYITSSEVVIKLTNDKIVFATAQEAAKLSQLLGNQIDSLRDKN
jgi:hypothetical protein